MPDRVVQGRVNVHPRGFGFVEADGADPAFSAFVPPQDLAAFLDGDLVEARLSDGEDGRLSSRGLKLLERAREELFGVVVKKGGSLALRVDREVANVDWPLEAPPGSVDEGAFAVGRIDGARAVLARVVEAAEAGVERVLVRHGIRRAFPEACLREARALPEVPFEGRRDLRAVPTVTIDAPHSKDLDDALAVIPAGVDGALRVLVSIADVDALVPAGSTLDEEARARGTSVYLAGRVVPMLPEEVSTDRASLLPGVDRLAVTVELRIDPEGTVTSVDVSESLVRSTARLSYRAVAAFLDEGRVDGLPPEVIPTLQWLRTGAARLEVVRRARGGVELTREEASILVDESTGEPLRFLPRASTSAHRLVERFMVAANEAVARFLSERGMPAIFRAHAPPEPERVRMLAAWARSFGFEPGFGASLTPRGLAAFEAQFKDAAVAPALYRVLARALGPARYTVEPRPHFGLAAPVYVQFTSPIRRYADLTVHRVVKAYLAGRRDLLPGDPALGELAARLDEATARASRAEADRHKMLAARLLAGRVGERFRGHVVAVRAHGLLVELSGVGVAGSLSIDGLHDGPYRLDAEAEALRGPRRSWTLGDPVDVEVAATNEELGRIELRPASP